VKTISETSTLVDVAFAVCTALDRSGITAVLTGGSAATYYAPDAYQSSDIDFVITFTGDRGKGEPALRDLGYRRKGDFYVHSSAAFPLEFPPGPLMIGDDLIRSWSTDARGREQLNVLSPTDCCRDRLAALLYWNDFSGLEQALSVCRAQWKRIDLPAIRTWCEREGQREKFELFVGRLDRLGLR
jgi:hypothetical protein